MSYHCHSPPQDLSTPQKNEPLFEIKNDPLFNHILLYIEMDSFVYAKDVPKPYPFSISYYKALIINKLSIVTIEYFS